MPLLGYYRIFLKRIIYVPLISAGLITIALLAGAHARLGDRMHTLLPPAQSAQEPVTAMQNQQQAEQVQVEVITVRATGFEPTEITRPAGRILLAVNNSSGLAEVTLRLARVNGETLHEVHVSSKGRNWRQRLELVPGDYVLTEANHPDWACHITVKN